MRTAIASECGPPALARRVAAYAWVRALVVAVLVVAFAATLTGLPASPAYGIPNCEVPNPPPVCDPYDPAGAASPKGAFQVTRLPGAGLIRVSGAALDPDASGPMSVLVFVNDVHRGSAQTDAATDAFSVDITTSPGQQSVCVVGVNRNMGEDQVIRPCRTFDVTVSPFGYLDSVTPGPAGVRIAGWAIDPDTSAPITVSVHVGAAVQTVTANADRADVGAVHAGYGSAHGFDVTIPAAKGRHTVCVEAINTGGGANTSLGCWQVDQGGPPLAPIMELRTHNVEAPVVYVDIRPQGRYVSSTAVSRRQPDAAWSPWSGVAVSGKARTWENHNVQAGETWCYRAMAKNTYGFTPSAEKCIAVPQAALPRPTGLAVTTSRNTVVLRWYDAAEGEDHFLVTVPGEPDLTVPAAPGTGQRLSHTFEGLQPATEYCFEVTTVKAGHDNTAPARVCATTPDEPAPAVVGISAVRVWNCANRGQAGSVWMWDYSAGGGWQRLATLPNGWVGAICGESAPGASVNLPDGHYVMLTLVVVDGFSCTAEDPEDGDCLKAWTNPLLGDAHGVTRNWTI